MTAATAAPSFFSDSDVTKQNVSFSRRNEIHHRHFDGRFPAATFPDQTHCLAGRDNERNIGDGLDMTDCSA